MSYFDIKKTFSDRTFKSKLYCENLIYQIKNKKLYL